MADVAKKDGYYLGRHVIESVRLDAQHLLWRMHLGYLLHPAIPITDGMKIADLGTGTGVWVLDASRSLPSDVLLHGYDISEDQFPIKDQWPRNISFGLLNSLEDPPAALVGQYDVVHVRMWLSILKADNIASVFRHIKLLLKPGGYLQWEDADMVHRIIRGEGVEKLESMMKELRDKIGIKKFNAVPELPIHLSQEGFNVIQTTDTEFQHDLIQLCTRTTLMAMSEVLRGINRIDGLSVKEYEDVLEEVMRRNRREEVYQYTPITILGRKEKD